MATADSMERIARSKASKSKPRATQTSSTDMIGEGMKLAMDEIYKTVLGEGTNSLLKGDSTKMTPLDWAGLATLGLGSGMFKTAKVASNVISPIAARALTADALRRPQIAMQLSPSAVEGVVRSGQFKNAFTLGDEAGQMPLAGTPQRVASEAAMGIPVNASSSQRPTYGILTSRVPSLAKPTNAQQTFRNTSEVLSPNNRSLGNYAQENRPFGATGDINFSGEVNDGVVALFKPSVAQRATVTRGDSNAAPWMLGGEKAVPLNISTASKTDIKKFANDILVPYKGNLIPPTYIEAQIFGKLGIDDVKKFVAGSPQLAKKLRETLTEMGKSTKVTLSNQAKLNAIKSIIEKLKPRKTAAVEIEETL
jgi:hypothetical protein